MKVYVGRAPRAGVGAGHVFIVEGDDQRPLTHHVYHSPDGFSWGYHGSGPAELARCLLWDVLGREPGRALYHDFKDDVIANLPSFAFWTLTEDEIRAYIKQRAERPWNQESSTK